MFPRGGAEGNIEIQTILTVFLGDQSLSDSLYGWKFTKPRCNSGRRSTFASKSVPLLSDVIDFAMLPAQQF